MLVQINWKPISSELRKFGLALIIGFGLIGAIVYFFGSKNVAVWMWAVSCAIGLLAIVTPPLSLPFYWVWMSIGFVIGSIISFLIILFIYYFIFTPVGLVMKVIGRDALMRKKQSFHGKSYWVDLTDPPGKDSYKRLF